MSYKILHRGALSGRSVFKRMSGYCRRSRITASLRIDLSTHVVAMNLQKLVYRSFRPRVLDQTERAVFSERPLIIVLDWTALHDGLF